MHPKLFSGWVLLAPFLSVVAANSNQAVLAPQWDDAPHEDGGIFKHPQEEKPTFEPIGTIYQHLANDDRYQLITKALNFVEDIGALLNDSSAQLTFFAPPDEVLRPPPGSPPHRNISSFFTTPEFLEGDDSALLAHVSQYRDLADLIPALEELDASDRSRAAGDEDDDKRKRVFKIILRAILSYHILPDEAYSLGDLGRNVTWPTKLQFHGAFDGQPQRLRVSQSIVAHASFVNFFTKIVHGDIRTSNGIIHVVNHAILPPPSVFQELYLIPKVFSTLTSALQRSELTGDVDLRYIHGKGLEGTSLVTVFAPTNRAFDALPKRLQLFLFSPFGEKALKKLLQYHIVPKAVIHSNYIHGEAVSSAEHLQEQAETEHHDHDLPKLPHHGKSVFDVNLTLSTLFENHTVNAHIVQKEFSFPSFPGHHKGSVFSTNVLVNSRAAIVPDVISLNGAIHVVDRILDPRRSHHHHHKHHGHHGHHGHHERSGSLGCSHRHHPESSAFDAVFGGAGEDMFIRHCSGGFGLGHAGPPCQAKLRGRRPEPNHGGPACRCAEEGHGHRDQNKGPCQCTESRKIGQGRIIPVEIHTLRGGHESAEGDREGGHKGESDNNPELRRVGPVRCDHVQPMGGHDDPWADWESWFPQWVEQV